MDLSILCDYHEAKSNLDAILEIIQTDHHAHEPLILYSIPSVLDMVFFASGCRPLYVSSAVKRRRDKMDYLCRNHMVSLDSDVNFEVVF